MRSKTDIKIGMKSIIYINLTSQKPFLDYESQSYRQKGGFDIKLAKLKTCRL